MLSSFSRLHVTTASLVIVGLSTVTTLPETERPLLVPRFGVGSATSEAPHQTPRAPSTSSLSSARRTYALVLLVTFQSKRYFISRRLVGSSTLKT